MVVLSSTNENNDKLPSGWSTRVIQDVARLVNGRGFKPHEWKTAGQPIIRIQNLNGSPDFNYYDGRFDPKIQVEPGQLLFAWSGSRGTSFGPHMWNGPRGVLNYHTWKIILDDRYIDPDFFFHVLRHLTKIIEDQAHGASALVHVQKWEIEKFPFQGPTERTEQQAIAEALSDADGVVEGLERLIEKKRRIKQGAMQDLLTAKRRLPGFSGEWGKFRLSEHGKFLSGSGFPLIYQGHSSGDYPFFKVSDFSGKNNKTQLTSANHYIDTAAQKNIGARIFPADAIVFAKIGAAIFLERKRMIAQDSCLDNNMAAFVLQDTDLCADLILAKFQTFALGDLVSSTALPAIASSDLKAIEFYLPKDLGEQEALASILHDMDAEITALETRLQKARAIKEGMMQNLLTGRIRLV